MLTGDKGETARQIGQQCGLLSEVNKRKDSIVGKSLQVQESTIFQIGESTSSTKTLQSIKEARAQMNDY